MVACDHHPSTWEVEAEGPGVQSHLQLHGEFEANLGSLRPCHKQNKPGAEDTDPHRGVTKESGLRETNLVSTLALGKSPCVFLTTVTKQTSLGQDSSGSFSLSPQSATRFIIKQPNTGYLNHSQKGPEPWGHSDSHPGTIQGERNFTSCPGKGFWEGAVMGVRRPSADGV